jgi:hypothetical protein
MTMQDHENPVPAESKHVPWNKGKLIGAKPPLRPKHVWSIRTKLQVEGKTRDLALFNLAIDSKPTVKALGQSVRIPGRRPEPRCSGSSLVLDAPNGQIKLDQKPPGIGTSFVTEVIKDKNGDLVNTVVQVVPNVNQTLGFSKESSTGSARPAPPWFLAPVQWLQRGRRSSP